MTIGTPRGRRTLVLVACGMAAVLAILAFAINSSLLSGLDTSIANWFDTHRTRRREREAGGVFGYIGRPVHVLIPAVVCGGLLSLRARSLTPAACVIGAVGLGAAVEGLMKATIGRTATSGPLVDYPHSFPSGHVTGSATLFGMIAVCLGVGAGRAVRAALTVAAVLGVVVVAYLALYTGAHTFTDVLGGMALGAAIVALGAATLGAFSATGA